MKTQSDLIRGLLKPGDTFVDIGAGNGITALIAAAAVGTHGTVLAVEPNTERFKRLRYNVANAPFHNVYCLHSPVCRLDHLLPRAELLHIDLIRVHCPNAEYEAMSGIAELVTGMKPPSVIFTWQGDADQASTPVEDMFKLADYDVRRSGSTIIARSPYKPACRPPRGVIAWGSIMSAPLARPHAPSQVAA